MDERDALKIILQEKVKKNVDVNELSFKKKKTDLCSSIGRCLQDTRIKDLEEKGILETNAFPFSKDVALYIARNLKEEELTSHFFNEYGKIDMKYTIEFLYKKYKELFNKAVEHYTEYEDVEVLKKNVIKFPSGRYVKEDETGACLIHPSEAYEIKKKLRFKPNVKAMTTRDKLKFVEYYLKIDTSISTTMLVKTFIREFKIWN